MHIIMASACAAPACAAPACAAPACMYLVTGGAGFIGSNLVRRLIRLGHPVRVLDSSCVATNINDRVETMWGDVTDAEDCARAMLPHPVHGPVGGVFHLAAMSKVAPSLGDVGMVRFCVDQNVVGTINVLEAVARMQKASGVECKVVYAASSTAYGCGGCGSDVIAPQAETEVARPTTPYALSKHVGEQMCSLFSAMHGVPTVRLRFFMVYGPGQPSEGAYAIVTGIFERARAAGQPLVVHGDGHQTRDFVHVLDVCDGCIMAMQSSDLVDDTINIGTGVSTSIGSLAAAVQPDPAMRISVPARAFDLRHTLCDPCRMATSLRLRPLRHLSCGSRPASRPEGERIKSTQVVVCRYREDVTWTDRWADQRIVYNKGPDDLHCPSVRLENVGRDSDTYLQHILRFYPDFADVTVFCQARIHDHCDPAAFASAVNAIVADELGPVGYLGLSDRWGRIEGFVDRVHTGDLPLREAWHAIFGTKASDNGDWRCNYNGLFAVDKERLLRHPRSTYEALLDVQRRLDPTGFANERMWTPLFGGPAKGAEKNA
jgi:nucleoside-diphosphate-sugar epimerase